MFTFSFPQSTNTGSLPGSSCNRDSLVPKTLERYEGQFEVEQDSDLPLSVTCLEEGECALVQSRGGEEGEEGEKGGGYRAVRERGEK